MSFELNKDVSFVLGKVYIKYHFQSLAKPLVFLFSPAQTEIPPENVRDSISPWGFATLKKLNFNVLSFTSLQPRNWYQHPVLRQYLSVQLPEMLPDFPERIGIGADVGGYGVSLYADALQCRRILLLNPISTLNQTRVPGENRYPQGLRNANWSKDDTDASKCACPGYLIYDRLSQLDHRHAQRYGSQLEHIHAKGLGENISKQLQARALFQSTLHSFLQNELTSDSFHKALRTKRNNFHHYHALLQLHPSRLTPKRKSIIENSLLSSVREYISNPKAARYGDASLLRDLAVKIEERDLTLAEHLMSQAHQIRSGPFITKKLNVYRNTLRKQSI